VIAVLLALVLGQDSVRARPLQLGDVYRTVLSSNARIGAAVSLANATTSRAASAHRPPDPEVQLGLMNYAVPGLRPMPAIGMTQIQLMQTLPVRGKLALGGRIADLSGLAAHDRVAEIKWSVRTAAADAFYDLYAASRSLEISRAAIRLTNDTYNAAQAMYRVGAGRQTDVLRAQLELARMAQDTMRTVAARAAAQARLMGLGVDAADLASADPLLPAYPDTAPALDQLSGLVSDRPMIRAMQRDVDAAATRVRLSRREIWPDLSVGLQGGQAGSERMASVMIGATVPLFAHDRQLRMRDEAAAMQGMANAELANAKAETRAAVIETLADLRQAQTLIALYRSTTLPLAQAAAASALVSYRAGQVDFMTLLDDRATVARYQQELVQLEADEGKAWARLEALVGHDLIESNASTIAIDSGRER